MAGQLRYDTDLMQATAQQSANKADNMIMHAKTLTAGIDYVSQRWQGLAGDEFRRTMLNQKTMLNQLIQKLQSISEKIKQGGQGLASSDASGRSKVQSQGETFLSGSLNVK
jgi:WXG100 family type VII secretion target